MEPAGLLAQQMQERAGERRGDCEYQSAIAGCRPPYLLLPSLERACDIEDRGGPGRLKQNTFLPGWTIGLIWQDEHAVMPTHSVDAPRLGLGAPQLHVLRQLVATKPAGCEPETEVE